MIVFCIIHTHTLISLNVSQFTILQHMLPMFMCCLYLDVDYQSVHKLIMTLIYSIIGLMLV